MRPIVKAFFDEATGTVSYVVSESAGRHCAIIDSVLDFDAKSGRIRTDSADEIVHYVKEENLITEWLLETHAHADHLSAASYIQQELGGKMAIGEHIQEVQAVFGKLFNLKHDFHTDGSQFDHLFKDTEEFQIGEMIVSTLHTPGHTPACMTYLIGDAAFVGDTLFMPDYGTARADFPGGDARQLYRSIQKLFSLPDDTRVFLCHDYKAPGRDEYQWETTIADERANNVHVGKGNSADDFVAMREARDRTLSMPALILPSIQVNIRGGELPDAEDNDTVYLKIPINQL